MTTPTADLLTQRSISAPAADATRVAATCTACVPARFISTLTYHPDLCCSPPVDRTHRRNLQDLSIRPAREGYIPCALRAHDYAVLFPLSNAPAAPALAPPTPAPRHMLPSSAFRHALLGCQAKRVAWLAVQQDCLPPPRSSTAARKLRLYTL